MKFYLLEKILRYDSDGYGRTRWTKLTGCSSLQKLCEFIEQRYREHLREGAAKGWQPLTLEEFVSECNSGGYLIHEVEDGAQPKHVHCSDMWAYLRAEGAEAWLAESLLL